jgi:hypothetical protein
MILTLQIAGGILLAMLVLVSGFWVYRKARSLFFWYYKDGRYWGDRG